VWERERLQKQLTAINNQIIRWLDIRFPEFNQVFKDWRGKTAWVTLRAFSTPTRIMIQGTQGVLECWRKHIKKASQKKAERLFNAAKESIGRTAGGEAAEVALQNLLTQYEMIEHQCQGIENLMQELLLRIPNAAKLLDIKGIGMITAAIIVSEIGDINRFKDPRQILKMAGLSLKENSSGKHKGKTTISKRGRRRLREGLFRAMIPMLANNTEFKMLHIRNITREKSPLNKMQSIIALCGKLVRVIYAIMTKGYDYDANKMISDMNRSLMAA
jgi:transposase